MFPVLELGPWQVSTYQVTATLAVVMAGMWTFHRLLRREYPLDLIIRGMFWTILIAFAGVYLATYLINVQRVAHNGILARPEGISIVWGLISGLGAAVVFCRRHHISPGWALDMAAPPTFLGLAIGRLGCASVGCCYGRPASSWMSVYLPDDHGFWLTRYPTQLMAFAADLLIVFILLAVERYGMGQRRKMGGWAFDGFLALLGLFLYSLKRFGLAFLRQSGGFPMIGSLSWMHISALIGMAGASLLILWNFYRNKEKRML